MYYVLYEYSREMYACLCSPLLALAPLPTINKCALLTLPLFASAADALRSAMICERMRAPRDVSTKFGNIDEC